MQTGKTMFIQTSKVLSIAKREIPGKHGKVDPGRKAMYQQQELQVLTGVLKVQLVHQHGLQRQPLADADKVSFIPAYALGSLQVINHYHQDTK